MLLPPLLPRYKMEFHDRRPTTAEIANSSGAVRVRMKMSVQRLLFELLIPNEMGSRRPQFRMVPVPSHRFAPLK
jgi:hypothetical protein